MRKSILFFALAAALSASAASAQIEVVRGGETITDPVDRPGPTTEEPGTPGRVYVGGEFGAMIVEDIEVDIGTIANAVTLDHNYGYDGGIFIGYDFGAFRVEGEVAYRKADLDAYQTTIRLPLEGAVFPSTRNAGGTSTALSFMLNGMLDFGDDDGISGFVGGGVGMARVSMNNARNFSNATPFLDDSDTKFAWQVFAGVRQRVRDNVDVTVKYRFFNADKIRGVAFNGGATDYRFRSHSLLGGITFRFGGSGPVTICQPTGEPVSAAKPCTVPVCENGSVLDAATGKCRIVAPDMKRCKPDGPLVSMDTELDCGTTQRPTFDVIFGWDKRHIGVPGDPGEDPNEDPAVIRSQVNVLAAALAEYNRSGQVRLNLVGYADRSGSDEYNQVLSCDRAHAVRKYFIDNAQPPIDPSLIQIEGRGETAAMGMTDREAQDRRVTIRMGDVENLAGSCPPPSPKMKW